MENALYIIAVIIAFGLTALLGKQMIPFLHKLKFGQTIREVGPSWHKKKQGTPTMGGLMFIIGISLAVLLCRLLYPIMNMDPTILMDVKLFAGLLMALAFGLVGFIDDYISVVKKRNLGLTEKQKLVLQFIIAAAYLASVAFAGGGTSTIIPFIGRVELGAFYYIISAVGIVFLVNAVNFTDGIDGLNSIVSFFSFIGLAICASILHITGITILGVAAAAGCLGFLVWNFHPAKVFMGDTGSLFLGGILCALAFGVDIPVLLIPAGIISLWEIISVIIQVTYFKLTGGKRVFKMTPIHHHYEMMGWSEVKICIIFGLISLIGGAVCIAAVLYGV